MNKYLNTIKSHFNINTEIRLSKYGKRYFWYWCKEHPTTGVICGFSRDGRCIYVRLEGRKSKSSYYKGFWEQEPA